MIVLDLDGTVIDIEEHHFACYRDILARSGFPWLPMARYWQAKRSGASTGEILAVTGADAIDSRFRSEWLQLIETEPYLRLDKLIPRALPVLERWAASGIPRILVTARRRAEMLTWQLDRLGISDRLSDVVIAEHGHGPHFKAVALAARWPLECVSAWIGDSEDDVLAARYAETRFIAVASGLRDRDYLQGVGCDVIVDDLVGAAAHPALREALREREGGIAEPGAGYTK